MEEGVEEKEDAVNVMEEGRETEKNVLEGMEEGEDRRGKRSKDK